MEGPRPGRDAFIAPGRSQGWVGHMPMFTADMYGPAGSRLPYYPPGAIPYLHAMMVPGMPMPGTHLVLGPGGYPMAIGPQPHLGAPPADPRRGPRLGNVFFKTRVCNKWRAGSCPYGDRCTYAHGEHELRAVAPEALPYLDSHAAGGAALGSRARGVPPSHDTASSADQSGSESGTWNPASRPFYKTRLCTKFMQTGHCHRGGACTYAHGYDDLRARGQGWVGTPRQGSGSSQAPGTCLSSSLRAGSDGDTGERAESDATPGSVQTLSPRAPTDRG
ncbi:NZF1 [Auxenochlorella protothecoides x Auxenochlorella symbiontica]